MEKRNNNEQKKIDNVLYILGLSGAVICCVYLLISKITGFRIENYLVPFPHRNRILLSGLWRNQSGMCSLSGTFSDILFGTSVCTVCSSTLRVVFIKPDDRTSLTP